MKTNAEQLAELLDMLEPGGLTPELAGRIKRKIDESLVQRDYAELVHQLKRHYDVICDINAILEPYKITAEKYLATLPKQRERLLLSQHLKWGNSRAAPGANSVPLPKYRHPEEPDKTWVGTGNRPRWFREHLARGGRAEDLLITPEAN